MRSVDGCGAGDAGGVGGRAAGCGAAAACVVLGGRMLGGIEPGAIVPPDCGPPGGSAGGTNVREGALVGTIVRDAEGGAAGGAA